MLHTLLDLLQELSIHVTSQVHVGVGIVSGRWKIVFKDHWRNFSIFIIFSDAYSCT